MDQFSELVNDYYVAVVNEDKAQQESAYQRIREAVILLLIIYGKRNLGFLISVLADEGLETPSNVSYTPSDELVETYVKDVQEVFRGLLVRIEEQRLKLKREKPDLSDEEVKQLILEENQWQVTRIANSYDSILEDATSLDIVETLFSQVGGRITKTWRAKIDSKTCAVCRALDGTTIGLTENFMYNGVGVTLSSHYSDVAMAHSNCRCHLEYHFERS